MTIAPNGTSTTARLTVPPLTTADPTGVRHAYATAISCPTTNFCAAIADSGTESYRSRPIAEVLSGGSWTALELPLPAGAPLATLTSISCPAAGVCVAVGSYYPPTSTGASANLVETLTGGRWSARRVPNAAVGDNSLAAVSCAAVGSCVAVGTGSHGPYALRLASGDWTPGALPAPP
ncbi:hypothetical protein [Lapillicoccus sp.]|uniref:hypothetical protein n=1 Tax=Lapillicoccus sp. TaxID=1909287 RepID=UPI0025D5B60B|nr:hypothetical protein [Lapillicoccus sp.]